MEKIIEDDEFVASFCCGCVNSAKKVLKNGKVVGFEKIGEMMLGDEFDFNDEESLINMAEFCISLCSRKKYNHKFEKPIIREIHD